MSEEDSTSDTSTQQEEESKAIEIPQVHNILNNTTHDENDTSEDEHVAELEPYTENGEQDMEKRTNSLLPIFKLKWENRKMEGPITYSTDQQIFKFKVNSGSNQEL